MNDEKLTTDDIACLISGIDKPKTGHWEHFSTWSECSECSWSTGKYISPSKYCPNCGARMTESN